MTDIKKEPVKRTPRSYDSILSGALSLPLIERAQLRDALVESVQKEKEALREAADKVKDL